MLLQHKNEYLTMPNLRLVTLLILPFLLSLSPKQEKEKYAPYQDTETGWSTQYPTSWKVISDKKMDKKSEKGAAKVEKNSGVVLQPVIKELLCLKKKSGNSFISISEPIDLTSEED